MLCSLCSFNNPPGSASCHRCGKKISDKTLKTVNQDYSNSYTHSSETKKINKTYIEEKDENKISCYTILVVEDNSIVRLMLQTILKVEGYRIIEATDGQQGVNKALQGKPDLILMDILLPTMNGIDAIHILKRNPKTSNIPIIATTCLDTKKDVLNAIEAGCNDYIKKPFTPEILLEKIQKLLGG